MNITLSSTDILQLVKNAGLVPAGFEASVSPFLEIKVELSPVCEYAKVAQYLRGNYSGKIIAGIKWFRSEFPSFAEKDKEQFPAFDTTHGANGGKTRWNDCEPAPSLLYSKYFVESALNGVF